MKIIIQAGGLGTRMKELVKNKPKGLTPVLYLPIIFHLFKKYPDNDFVIIGDYKFSVLDKFLQTFAKDVSYILIRSHGKGNICGIKQAVSLVPEKSPLMIIWSDLILSDEFTITNLDPGCSVGISGDYLCSWSLENGELVNSPSKATGVAGCFVFDNKSYFDDHFPETGSFTRWLKDSGIPLHPLDLQKSIDVGTFEMKARVDNLDMRCRPYNKMTFTDGKVFKTGLTEEAKHLIDREALWYKEVSNYGFTNIPKVFSYDPLIMEQISGDNIFRLQLKESEKKATLKNIVAALNKLHQSEPHPVDKWDIYAEYFTKTIARLRSISMSIPFSHFDEFIINGRNCKNIIAQPDILRQQVLGKLLDTLFAPIHGDCTLTNILSDDNGEIFFIDARGYFGKKKVIGDIRYDWAKLYYSIEGNFDQFNVRNFQLDIAHDGVEYRIGSNGWEYLTPYFFDMLPDNIHVNEIKLIHSITWLSLASHAWEDYDSMCTAFYNGLYLFNECLYGDKYDTF